MTKVTHDRVKAASLVNWCMLVKMVHAIPKIEILHPLSKG